VAPDAWFPRPPSHGNLPSVACWKEQISRVQTDKPGLDAALTAVKS